MIVPWQIVKFIPLERCTAALAGLTQLLIMDCSGDWTIELATHDPALAYGETLALDSDDDDRVEGFVEDFQFENEVEAEVEDERDLHASPDGYIHIIPSAPDAADMVDRIRDELRPLVTSFFELNSSPEILVFERPVSLNVFGTWT
ncbi:hypothetical protein PVAG01_04346 [Phlyctema vagabunda]|uniref:Uncharacterized protein n=1 Tax=Phlyctema vagabunda TaxID=108571 RepID=A0ABR4PNW8_9HELO